jgi:PAS domain S-box-containing protein
MSVKVKTILLTMITLLVMGGGIFLLSQNILLARYSEMDEINQNNELGQISRSVDRFYANLGDLAMDWAIWDDSDQFLLGKNPTFTAKNFQSSIYETLPIELVALANRDGTLLFSERYDRASGTANHPDAEIAPLMQPGGAFWGLETKNSVAQGTIKVGGRAYLATARPVYPTNQTGPSSGVILFAREINEELLDSMRVDSGIANIDFYFSENVPEYFKEAFSHTIPGQTVYHITTDPDTPRGFILLFGPDGKPTGMFEPQLTHTIYQQGVLATQYYLGGMLLIGAASLLLNLFISNFLLFRPLEQLAQRVKQANNLQEQIETLANRPAELETISQPLETVLQRAQQAHQESLDRKTLYTRLFEQAREGFAILDVENLEILDANEEFARIFDWQRDKEPRKDFQSVLAYRLDAETVDRLVASGRDVAQGKGRLYEQELHLRGINWDVEISISPIQVGQNRYLYALLRDVSERTQLEETLQEQLRETTLLNQMIAVTTTNLEPTAVFETACRELAINLGVPQAVLGLFNSDRTHLEVVAEYTHRKIPSSIGTEIPMVGSVGLDDFRESRGSLQVDIDQAPEIGGELRDLFEKRGTEAALLVPLIVRDTIIGWLMLEDLGPRKFNNVEIRLAEDMALAASRAYEVTALYHNLQFELARRQKAEEVLDKRRSFLETLVKMLTELLSLEDSATLYDRILPVLGEITQTDRVSVYELFPSAEGQSYLRRMYAWENGLDRSALPGVENQPIKGELVDLLKELRTGQYIAGNADRLPAALRAQLEAQGIKSTLILPLFAKGAFSGAITFTCYLAEREWDALEVALLQAAAASATLTAGRIEAGEALRDSEGRYRLVVENARDVIFQIDMTGCFTFLNPAWETITGLKVEDTLGLPFWKAAPESMVQELGAGFRILREHVTDRYHQTIAIKNVHGKQVWLDAFIRIVEDTAGSGQLIAGTMVDITSYKRIEYILRRNEEALRSLSDITSSLSLTFEKKLSNLLMLGTQTFELEYGFLGRISGDNLAMDYVYPEESHDQPLVVDSGLTFLRETLRANEPLGIENIPASDWANHPASVVGQTQAYLGTTVMVGKDVFGILSFYSRQPRTGAFSLADKEFILLMAQWVGADIERERYTQQLKAFNEEIANKSDELAVARDQALEASRLKSEFLATMSHEIRTPLNAVIGMAEMLIETPLNDEQNDFAGTIRDSGKSLLTIINDILDFSKIEAGRMTLESVDFQILPLVDGVMEMFAQVVQKKGIGLYSYISPDVPPVLIGDPVRLRQVLTNLVGNGLKFTDHGEVVVRVDLAGRNQDLAEVVFKVGDTGIGLSEVARWRLFNPFTQADGSTTRKYGGTGLGLAISKSLVKLMGGEIGVKSVEGVGSTFWFKVPLPVNLEEEAAARERHPDLESIHALIVDSIPAQRRFLAALLRSWGGVEVDSAWDFASAIDLIAHAYEDSGKGYQLAVCDLTSPDIDVGEIRRILSARTSESRVKIIYLAGYDQRELAEGLVREGGGAYLVKPVRQSVMFDLIVTLCEEGETMQVRPKVTTVQMEVPPEIQESAFAKLDGTGWILLAEDNPANQRLATVQLKRLGYQTELASNGAQALRTYLESPRKYMAILMDCQMPILDGFDATRQIRAAETNLNRHIPIIAMTANAMQGDKETCLQAGMDDYVSKPVSLESLRQAINRIQQEGMGGPDGGEAATVAALHNTIDQSVLVGLRELQEEGQPDFLTELIDIYLEDSVKLVEEIRAAVQADDAARVRQAAHTLKGSSGNLGANGFSKLCYEMELYARDGEMAGARKTLPALQREYDLVTEGLANERKAENEA